jgi:aryl-alcohol dehydrogenase-like predicted oxidoreductase
MNIEMQKIGDTEIMVSPVALGCWPISGMTSLDVNDDDSLATLRAAIEVGINFFDTAYCYGANGESEKLVGQAIREFAQSRDDVVIATKGGVHWDLDGGRLNIATPERLIQECDESLQRLGVDTIDLLYLHSPAPDVPVADSAGAYVKLLEAGKIRSVGVSNCTLAEIESFHSVCKISAVQPRYNMLQRGIESDIVPWCVKNNVSIMNYWPLMKGLLAGKIRRGHQFDENDKRLTYEVFQGEAFERAQRLLDGLDVIAAECGKSVSQVVINWNMNQPGITSVLCGAKRDWQIQETAGAMGWNLSREQLAAIESLIDEV